jgi:hypothetical protein
MADVDASGTLDSVEFDALLQLHALAVTATSITQATTSDSNDGNVAVTVNCGWNRLCVVTRMESVITAAYAALVCASCSWNTATTATTTALDISCCTNGETGSSSSTGISISVTASPMALRTESKRAWIQRLCLAATALVECTSTTVAPLRHRPLLPPQGPQRATA